MKRDTVDSPIDWDEFINDLDTTLQDVDEFDPVLPEDPGELPESFLFIAEFKDYLVRRIENIFRVSINGNRMYVVEEDDVDTFVGFTYTKYGNGTAQLHNIFTVANIEFDPIVDLPQFTLTTDEILELGEFFRDEILPKLHDFRRRQFTQFMMEAE